MPPVGAGTKLQVQDFKDTAADLGVGVAQVKAVQSVESAGSGFIEDGRPVIRFEAHVFAGDQTFLRPGLSQYLGPHTQRLPWSRAAQLAEKESTTGSGKQ